MRDFLTWRNTPVFLFEVVHRDGLVYRDGREATRDERIHPHVVKSVMTVKHLPDGHLLPTLVSNHRGPVKFSTWHQTWYGLQSAFVRTDGN